MMKSANVVIGANFGDEGKGLVTDFLSAPRGGEGVVARFNGGAQAGHTVTTPDGRRHIFSHFGSGSFSGAATFLSRFFVCNPLLFAREHALLASRGVKPVVHIDAQAPVTTPFDMMANQIVEEHRGKNRHGSCGLGFGETLERMEKSPLTLRAGDLGDAGAVKDILRRIRTDWLPQRLAALGVTTLPPQWQERVYSDGVMAKFMEDTAFFLSHAKVVAGDFLSQQQNIVFEGAQGLLLDAGHEWFPHVTRSNTGIKNVLSLAEEAGIGELRVHYITRAYATRHGAGPLPHELPEKPYRDIRDDTNVHNDWQGTLRFAWLDADLLAKTILADGAGLASPVRVRRGLALTCLDQVPETVAFVKDGRLTEMEKSAFADTLKRTTQAEFMLQSFGPARADVRE